MGVRGPARVAVHRWTAGDIAVGVGRQLLKLHMLATQRCGILLCQTIRLTKDSTHREWGGTPPRRAWSIAFGGQTEGPQIMRQGTGRDRAGNQQGRDKRM